VLSPGWNAAPPYSSTPRFRVGNAPAPTEQLMDFDVNAYRDAQRRWHYQILGPLPLQASDAPVYEECHDPKASIRCIGFPDFTAAINDGWTRVRVILKRNEGAPQKETPPASEIRSKP
jgi:hypothetical protein